MSSISHIWSVHWRDWRSFISPRFHFPFLYPRSSWHSAILVLPRVTPTYSLLRGNCSLYCAHEIMDGMSILCCLYVPFLSHARPIKCHGLLRLGRPPLCGCSKRRGAAALMWNSLGETRRKLISLPGMRSLDTAAPTIHPSSITLLLSFFLLMSLMLPLLLGSLDTVTVTLYVRHLSFFHTLKQSLPFFSSNGQLVQYFAHSASFPN